jgi:catechol 2,3-dioxygenase-like lactoylglutathione lyase family enzyme
VGENDVQAVGASGRDGTAPFELGGINHLALVCRDMGRTVDFYTNVLGMPLVKTIELPAGMGQHFFFDCGGGDCLAFFWFPEAPEPVPGVSGPRGRPDQAELTSAIGSMNHVAFTVPAERIEGYRDRLEAAGVACTEVANHDDSEWGLSKRMHPGVFVRSIYFQDPDGILLEFAAWTRALTPGDVRHEPARAADAAGAWRSGRSASTASRSNHRDREQRVTRRRSSR